MERNTLIISMRGKIEEKEVDIALRDERIRQGVILILLIHAGLH